MLEAAEPLGAEGISCEVIDLRTIVPLDVETVVASVNKTHHLLVVDEGFAMCGLGAEMAAAMMEHAFDELDAPVGRLHTDPVGHPFSPAHENAVVVSVDRIVSAVHAVVARKPLIPRRFSASSRPATTSARTRRGLAANDGDSIGARDRVQLRRAVDHAQSGPDDSRSQGPAMAEARRRHGIRGGAGRGSRNR